MAGVGVILSPSQYRLPVVPSAAQRNCPPSRCRDRGLVRSLQQEPGGRADPAGLETLVRGERVWTEQLPRGAALRRPGAGM